MRPIGFESLSLFRFLVLLLTIPSEISPIGPFFFFLLASGCDSIDPTILMSPLSEGPLKGPFSVSPSDSLSLFFASICAFLFLLFLRQRPF